MRARSSTSYWRESWTIGDKVMTLHEGDSIYFDASQQHCMRAVGGRQVKFVCIVI